MPEHTLSSNIWRILVCPQCIVPLEPRTDGAFCLSCHCLFPYLGSGALDLRPQKILSRQQAFNLNPSPFPSDPSVFGPLAQNKTPEVDLSGVPVPYHLSRELMSWFPRAKSTDSLVLDLGCGNAIHRDICEACGFEYVGLDFDSSYASILGDAHLLPFKDESFEFILSIAVLEHIRYPFLMAAETQRVLKARGKFIGTVAFLEPFHSDSFYHHTHLGLLNLLSYSGLKVERIAPSKNWPGLKALGRMGLFPRMPAFLAWALLWPIEIAHHIWWRAAHLTRGRAPCTDRSFRNAGAFVFIAAKE